MAVTGHDLGRRALGNPPDNCDLRRGQPDCGATARFLACRRQMVQFPTDNRVIAGLRGVGAGALHSTTRGLRYARPCPVWIVAGGLQRDRSEHAPPAGGRQALQVRVLPGPTPVRCARSGSGSAEATLFSMLRRGPRREARRAGRLRIITMGRRHPPYPSHAAAVATSWGVVATRGFAVLPRGVVPRG